MRAMRMLEILVPVAAGCILTFGMAWGIAAYGTVNQYTGQYRGTLREARIPAYLRAELPPPREVTLMPGRQWGHGVRGSECELPGVSSLPAGWFTVWSVEFGWPLRAMAWHELNFRPQYDQGSEDKIRQVTEAHEVRGVWAAGIVLSEAPPVGTGRRRLPLEVLWGGFAVNTACAAGIVWLAFFAPWRVRDWRRLRRGACVRCGYDRRGLSVCPECGATAGADTR